MTDEELAEAHAAWFAKICQFVFKEAMLHGIKHGRKTKVRGADRSE